MIDADEFIFREAFIDDADELAFIIQTSFRTVASRFNLTEQNAPTHPSNCTTDWIRAALSKGIKFYILTSANSSIGCVALEKVNNNICYIERLSVLPSYRFKGYGSRIVEEFLLKVRELDIKRVEIGIIAEDATLTTWYEKRGFILKDTKKFDHLPFTVAFLYRNIE